MKEKKKTIGLSNRIGRIKLRPIKKRFRRSGVYFDRMQKRRHRIGTMVRKELDWVTKDRISLIVLFGLPLFLIFMLGYVEINFAPPEVPVVYIIDMDQSEYSQAYIDTFRNYTGEYLEIHDSNSEPESITLEKAEELIPTTHLQAYIIIPDNFSESLQEQSSARVQIFIDGIDIRNMYFLKYNFIYANMQYQVEYQIFNSEVLYFPEERPSKELPSITNIISKQLPVLLFGVMNMIVSQSIVGDEPLKRMLLSPTRKYEVVIAKTIAYSYLGGALSLLCDGLLYYYFHVEFVSFYQTFLISFIATFFAITFGIFFSAFSKTRISAAQLFLFLFLMQLMIVNNLRIEPIVHYMPIEIVRSVFIDVAYRGVSIMERPVQLRKIILINALMIVLSIFVYGKKREEV